MIWILLIMFSNTRGMASITAEFNTKEACVAAATGMKERHPYYIDEAFCVPKGEKK
jgi:hypothetical protein